MSLTTPPRPVALADEIPELARLARVGTRLHPRPGSPTVLESSVGGPLLWPEDEPWPFCPGDHAFEEDGSEPLPLIPGIQLYLRDAPALPHPAGADLLQLMWCPTLSIDSDDHTADGHLQAFWRASTEITTVLGDPPRAPRERIWADIVPAPCVVHPEHITEYPTADWLPEELAGAAERWEAIFGEDWRYTYNSLAVAQGIKVGGWAGAASFWGPAGPEYFRCECGAALDALVQLDNEWDGSNIWRPIEDAESTTYELRRRTQLAADLQIGRGYALQTYYCTADWTHPIARYMQ
ncbi:hypothetical protein ACWZJV_22170 [Nocardioides sp. WG-D5]